jgi:hypothetical protein
MPAYRLTTRVQPGTRTPQPFPFRLGEPQYCNSRSASRESTTGNFRDASRKLSLPLLSQRRLMYWWPWRIAATSHVRTASERKGRRRYPCLRRTCHRGGHCSGDLLMHWADEPGSRHSRCRYRVLQKPILGTADSEYRHCLGVRSFLLEIHQASMTTTMRMLVISFTTALRI